MAYRPDRFLLLLSLLPGPAVVVYIAAWLVLPDQRNGIALESFLAKRSSRPNGGDRPQTTGSWPLLFSAGAHLRKTLTSRRLPLPRRRVRTGPVTVCVLPHTGH